MIGEPSSHASVAAGPPFEARPGARSEAPPASSPAEVPAEAPHSHLAHRAGGPRTAGFKVITVSDSRTEETDTGGRLLCQLVEEAGHQVRERTIVPDEPAAVAAAILAGLEAPDVDLVVLTGGTGISSRDGTVEVVSHLLEKRIDGFGELFRSLSFQQVGSAAMLSRAVGGLARGRCIFALPGSPRAVELAMRSLILPEVSHLLFEVRR